MLFETNTGIYEYNEPRYTGLIELYNPGNGNFYVVVELRKKNIPIVSNVENYVSGNGDTYWITELKNFF